MEREPIVGRRKGRSSGAIPADELRPGESSGATAGRCLQQQQQARQQPGNLMTRYFFQKNAWANSDL